MDHGLPSENCIPKHLCICNNQQITIAEAGRNNWNLSFRRNFGSTERGEWLELIEQLESVTLSGAQDRVMWILELSGSSLADNSTDLLPLADDRP